MILRCWLYDTGDVGCMILSVGCTGDRNVLNQASVPILHNYWCSRQDWYGNKFFWKVTFCAGFKSGTRDACTGDSGGPLACKAKNGRWYVQGVTSWGFDCGQENWPGIYTDVSVYAAWIRHTALSLGIPILNDDSL
ncbi:serine protease 41-like [Mya arenaria]|uniref:serine protease 41-like n=1 Tax=Mya arenaria TaxID=6604 RepID=UPI0022E7B35B|nr:serine protease 41-like [Mya arenaria]